MDRLGQVLQAHQPLRALVGENRARSSTAYSGGLQSVFVRQSFFSQISENIGKRREI